MANTETVLTADVSKALAALRSLEAAESTATDGAEALARALSQAESQAQQLAEAAEEIKRRSEGLDEEAIKQVEAAKKLASQRRLEADALAHEADLLRAMGGEQADINRLLQASLGLRREAATLSLDAAAATKISRQQELATVQSVRQAQKAADAERSAAQRAQADALDAEATAQAEAAKARAVQLQLEADAIEHEADLLRELGGEQADINRLLQSSLSLRREAAALTSDAASAAKILRQQELAAVRSVRQAQNAADAERSEDLRSQAEALEHQAELMRIIGGEQKDINRLLDQALEKRKESADLAGDTAEKTRSVRQRELEVARQAADERDEAERKREESLNNQTSLIDQVQAHWLKVVGAVVAIAAAVELMNETMQRAFTTRTIFDNLPFKIDGARKATLGMVKDLELSRLAIEAQRLKVVDSEEGFAELAEAATKLGLSVGLDAATSVENLSAALGKGETELLDNLGVTLKVSEAQRLYAEQLGVATNELSDSQKAEAFRIIGLEKAIDASNRVKISVNEQEQAWIGARQKFDAFVRESIPEATKRMGGLWETMADGTELAEDLLPVFLVWFDGIVTGLKPVISIVGFFGRQLAALGRAVGLVTDAIGRAVDQVVEWTAALAEWLSDTVVGDAVRWVEDLGVATLELADEGLERLTEAVEDNIPLAREMKLSWDSVTDSILGTNEAIGTLGLNPAKELLELMERGKKLSADQGAADAQRVSDLGTAVIWADHMVALAEAEKRSASDLERLYRLQHAAKIDLLDATGEQAKLEAQLRDEEVRQTAARSKRRGGGKGPTDSARLEASGKIILQQFEDRLALMEVEAQLTGEQIDADGIRHRIALQELELERQVLGITRAKNSIERERNAARLEAIDREVQILDLEREVVAVAQLREGEEVAAESRIEQMDREIERLDALGVATQLLQERRDEAQEQLTATFGTAQEQTELAHERAMANIEARELARIQAVEAELLAFEQEVELAAARGEMVEDLAGRRIQLEGEVAAAQGDAAKQSAALHQQEVARIEERVRKQREAIGAANSALGVGANFAKTIIDVAIKDDEKREKAALRLAGVMAIARGALETVEAVAAFASFNFVQGALHTAAAAVAFVQGGIMLAGQIPSKGGGGAAGAGRPSGRDTDRLSNFETSINDDEGGLGIPPVPPSAEELARIRGTFVDGGEPAANDGGGSPLTNNGIIIAGSASHLLGEVENGEEKAWGT